MRLLPSIDVGAEEEVKSASLIANAIEWGLRFVMFDNGWSSIGENIFVQSTFSSTEERKHLQAINVSVQAEINEGIVFLVSPDIIWFKRHKISDLASSGKFNFFESGSIVNFDAHVIPAKCTVLPSLYEGHVIGISKALPERGTLNWSEELLLFKNGLSMPSSYFLNIQFNNRGHINKQWYPSAFVMQGPGLSPAPYSIRTTKAMHALDFFMHLIEGWDFFSQGPLKVKEVSLLGTSTLMPVWMTATSTLDNSTTRDDISYNGRTDKGQNAFSGYHHLSLDYHTPKPLLGYISASKENQSNVFKIITPSSKPVFDVKAKHMHNADITKPIFVKRGPKSKSDSKTACSATEIKLQSKIGFMHELTVEESGFMTERKVAEKNFISENVKLEATKERTNAESGTVIGNEMSQKDASSDAMIESTGDQTQFTDKTTKHDSTLAQTMLAFAEDCMSCVASTEAMLATESKAEIMLTYSKSCMGELQHGVYKQTVEDYVQSNRASGNNEEVEACMHKQCLADSKIDTVKLVEVLANKTLNSGKKSKEAASGACKKIKTKPYIDTSDIVVKVLDCHNRGALQLLTVLELKSFLATKKAKVGGKKEELIQRINSILSVVT